MFDEKYATSEVGISCYEVFEGLDEVDVCGLVVRVDCPTKDAAIHSLSRARDGGVTLRAKCRGVNYLVSGHHADILLERSSVLKERGQQLFGLTLWAHIKSTYDNSELNKGRDVVSALLFAVHINAAKGHLLHRIASHYRGLQPGMTASRACSDRMKPGSQRWPQCHLRRRHSLDSPRFSRSDQ
jgi:hypothetical protein